jgi:hypothetical protein
MISTVMIGALVLFGLLATLLVIGDQTFDYFHGPMVTFETEEGDYTVSLAIVDGGEDNVGTFPAASQIRKGNFLVAETPGSDGFLRVKRPAAGTQNLLGFAFVDAEVRKEDPLPTEVGVYDDSPGLPKPHREVTVELLGDFIREVPLAPAGTNVTLGGSVAPDSAAVDVWEGDATPNGTYALKAATLGTDTTVPVLFKYDGRF